jgi:Asp/Glu/hydantoin racemase
MAMKLWHQSMTVLTDLPGYADTVRTRITKVVREDTVVAMHGFAPGSFPANYPGPDIAHTYLYQLHAHQVALAAMEAERQGYDAVVLASLPSPLIREIRTLVDIPVAGYGDTAFRMAGLYGRRFGLLLFNVERTEFWYERVRELGVAESFVGVRPSGVTFAEVAAAHGDKAAQHEVIRRVSDAAARMVEELQADVLVPGEMPLNVLLAEAGVGEIAGATVMDGLACTFKTAEMMVDLRRISGMQQSRRGYFHAPPSKERVREALAFYGMEGLTARLSEPGA